jgi:hypothetical protein
MKYLLITILIFTAISCRKDKVEEIIPVQEECPEERSFSDDVLPILSTNCSTSGCHNANTQAAGYIFETHQQIDQHAVIILSAMKHETSSPMPQGADQLNDSLIETFDCWIKQGKLNN